MELILHLFFFCLLLYGTQHQSHAQILPHQQHPSDTYTTGNYRINNCHRINRSSDLQTLLTNFQRALHSALSDIHHGTASHHGFRTFFKSNTNIAPIERVFRAIATGRNLTITITNTEQQRRQQQQQPRFECGTPAFYNARELANFNTYCNPPSNRHPSHAAALPLLGAVVLCPAFWDLPDFPHEHDCPRVMGRKGRRQFVDNGKELRDTKFAVLVHELVHLYNTEGEGRDRANEREEVYDIRELVGLRKEEAVGNAESWAVYAAGSYCFPSLAPFFAFLNCLRSEIGLWASPYFLFLFDLARFDISEPPQ
ncbi:MAG: hypothetical protein Q9226_003788 [Calogaya cf. arnoldii]